MKRAVIAVLAILVAAVVIVWVSNPRTPASNGRTSERVVPPPQPPQPPGGPVVSGGGNRSVAPVVAPAVAQFPAKPEALPKPVSVGAASVVPPSSGPVGHFADTRIPFAQRTAELQALGRKGDTASQKTLMSVGDAPVYANRYAVEALGQCRGPEVRAYLAGKLNDPDALLAMAAIRALEQVAAGAAIPALTAALVENRERPDGHQEMVCTEAVKALGLTASAQAAPALIAELQRADQPGWSLEYGSAVIAALRNMDSTEGVKSVAVYADVLSAHRPEERMARAYYERKIAEARGRPVPPP